MSNGRGMNAMLKMLVAILLLTAAIELPFGMPSVQAAGTTYYVSSSAGNDGNNGTLTSTPWKSLVKLSSVTFKPGDVIKLLGGDTWDNGETLSLHGNGTAANPITLTAYGTGRPKLVNAGTVIYMEDLSGWNVNGLEIFNKLTDSLSCYQTGPCVRKAAIDISFFGTGISHDITIDNNLVYGLGNGYNTTGIFVTTAFWSNYKKEVAYNLNITNNVVHDFGWYGIGSGGWNEAASSQIFTSALFRNVKMNHNTVYNVSSLGVAIANANNSEMKWNTVHDIGFYSGTDPIGTAAVMPIISSHIDVMFNEVYNVSDNGSGNDAYAIDIDWTSEFVNVQYNRVYDTLGGGIETMANTHSTIANNRMSGGQGKTAVGNGAIGITDFTGDLADYSGTKNLTVRNNLIVVDQPNTAGISAKYVSGGTWTGNQFTNNKIILTTGVSGTEVYNYGANASVAVSDYNKIYSSGGSAFSAHYNGTNYTGLSGWRSGTGYDANSSTLPLDTTAPTNPSGATASWNSGNSTMSVTWTAATDAGSGISHYNIYRSTASSFTPGYTNMVGQSTTTSFADTQELQSSTVYYYKIQAEDNNGNVSAGTATANATSGTVAAPPLARFQASIDFSAIRQGPIWNYDSFDGNNYTNIASFDYSYGAWRDGATYLNVSPNSQHPESAKESVRAWVAPYTGTITVTAQGNISLWSSGGDGVNVRLLKNGTQLWPASGYQLVTYGAPVSFPTTSVSVAKGDTLYFAVNRNVTATSDSTTWDPVITYTAITEPTSTSTYQASTGFSTTTQGPVWYYQKWNGISFTNIAAYDASWSSWRDGATYLMVGINYQHPESTASSARTWVAPAKGTVAVSANGNLSLWSPGGDGVLVKIMKNGIKVWPRGSQPADKWQYVSYSSPYTFPTQLINVTEGDQLEFTVNMNGTITSDATTWDPIVQYQ
ncbi:hypothetical protein [Cohnella silvisoli]|uniref:Fibronectin type-III domain-containing protein n=1 Tax=Cohnella silvisoli TaxID=2873699 RepID=A0ABV1L2M8_9BACL|nr:hypothetical protein [Cohnella silvisoli]MCD9021601.1 hypothetical protein [Cohnella silvisoli]